MQLQADSNRNLHHILFFPWFVSYYLSLLGENLDSFPLIFEKQMILADL